MPTQDEAQTPLPHGQCPRRDRVRKVGRIGSLLCTLTLALMAVGAVIVSGFLYFNPRFPVLRGLLDSAGIKNPVIVVKDPVIDALSMLALATWVYALWILRRLFVEFSQGIVLSVRNARAICWLGIITIFGMFSFNPSGEVHRAPLVSFSASGKMYSAGEETPSERGLSEKFSGGF